MGNITSISVAASTTIYINLAGGTTTFGSASEALANYTIYQGGQFLGLRIRIVTNDRAASTFGFRINAGAGSQVCSIGSSTTGIIRDTTHFDKVVSGDVVNNTLTTGAGGTVFTFKWSTVLFASTYGTVQLYQTSDFNGFTTANGTFFTPTTGRGAAETVTEANVQTTFRTAGILSGLQVYIRTNARTTTSNARSRIATANGTMVIPIAGGTTAFLSDTTHTDAVVAGNLVNYSTDMGNSSESLRYYGYGSMFTTTNNAGMLIAGNSNANLALTVNKNLTQYMNFGVLNGSTTTESQVQMEANVDFVGSLLEVLITSNTVSGASTFTFRKNGGAGNQVCSIGSSTNGLIRDTTHTDQCVSTDLIDLELITANAGTSMLVWNADMLVYYQDSAYCI